MWEILIEFFIKILGRFLPVALRRIYPPKRIQGLIKIQVSSDGEGVALWNGEMPKAKVWVEIINLSPFPLEIDRAYGSFEYGSELEKFVYVQKTKIPSSSIGRIHVEASLTKEHAAVIQRLMPSNPNPVLNFNAHVLCKIHNFDINRRIQTSHFRLVNFSVARDGVD